MSSDLNGHEREMPYAHLYHFLIPIFFIAIWVLDAQIFQISTILNEIVPFTVRIFLFIVIFILALYFIQASHKALFKSHKPSNSLINSGILGKIRNPMYFGILLIYISLIFLSISLISAGFFIIIFFLYNKMVKFEERILENLFGQEFLEYKNDVPKWFPKIIK